MEEVQDIENVNPDVQEQEVVPDDEMQVPMYNKIQVADVVKREKQKAYEKGRLAAMQELQAQQQQLTKQHEEDLRLNKILNDEQIVAMFNKPVKSKKKKE